jgi:hypothetical protein
MTELLDGVFAIARGDLPESWEFLRLSKEELEQQGYQGVAEGPQPLKHICERSDDPTQEYPTDIVVLANVTWDYARGFYYCKGCKSVFDRDGDLEQIWEDGEGTGHEGTT